MLIARANQQSTCLCGTARACSPATRAAHRARPKGQRRHKRHGCNSGCSHGTGKNPRPSDSNALQHKRCAAPGSSQMLKTPERRFHVREVFGDGNCMFRAISYIIWGTEDNHRHLRSSVVRHIEKRWPELKPHVQAEWSMSRLSEYVGFMGSNGTFASELECIVAARLYRHSLAIYRRLDVLGNLRRILVSRFSPRARVANLLFSGRNEFGHYDVLLACSTRPPR